MPLVTSIALSKQPVSCNYTNSSLALLEASSGNQCSSPPSKIAARGHWGHNSPAETLTADVSNDKCRIFDSDTSGLVPFQPAWVAPLADHNPGSPQFERTTFSLNHRGRPAPRTDPRFQLTRGHDSSCAKEHCHAAAPPPDDVVGHCQQSCAARIQYRPPYAVKSTKTALRPAIRRGPAPNGSHQCHAWIARKLRFHDKSHTNASLGSLVAPVAPDCTSVPPHGQWLPPLLNDAPADTLD